MSFYNMLFGKNPSTEIILALIGLKECDVERFRDCGISDDEIYIYTRTGGGNREDYPNQGLTANPYYKYDTDDDFDSTYATYYFRFPEEIKTDIPCLFNVEDRGIPANLIKWINKTLNRELTEKDKNTNAYSTQRDIMNGLMRSGNITEPWNGHTCIILSDGGAEAVFQMIEKDGEFKSYYAVPYKFSVIRDDYEYEWYKKTGGKGQWRIKVGQPKNWELDIDAANRYMLLFGETYPKAAAYLKDRWY